MTAGGGTWANTHRFGATGLDEPRDVDELARLIRGSDRVRALGTRHSFNDLADTDGRLVSLARFEATVEVAAHRRSATVGAGTTYGAVAKALEAEGLALHNMGSLPHISIGGATATGTHGSGDANGNLSTAVAALHLVTADGGVRRLARGDEGFDGAVVGLGALGVVTALELDVQPAFRMRQDVYRGVPWEVLLDDPESVTGSAYSVSVFTDWVEDTIGAVWRKSRLEEGDDAVDGRFDVFAGVQRDPASRPILPAPESTPDNTTVQGGVPGRWLDRLPHFRVDSVPSAGDEIQTEYFVPRADAASAITAVRELAADIAPLLLITELRTVAADDLWLSPAYGRDSLAIHFTWHRRPEAVLPLLPRIEAALAPFGPRPHWGKWHTFSADDLRAAVPRMSDFASLRSSHDPTGKFAGPALRRWGLAD